jgi:hypothetical protein
MTSKTTYAQLYMYNTTTDSGCPVYDYINNVSGSLTGQNLYLIDYHGARVSASLTTINNSYLQSAGSYIGAPAAAITAGSSNVALISPSGLAHSAYGTRSCSIPLNKLNALVGIETGYILIPRCMNGWILIDAQAACAGSSISGSPTFAVHKRNSSSASLTSMLSTNIKIDEGEWDSSLSSTPRVISATGSAVFTGYMIKVSNVISGSNVTYSQVSLSFQNRP